MEELRKWLRRTIRDLFGKRAPAGSLGDYDKQIGNWREPDLVLVFPPNVSPIPSINNNCKTSFFIYAQESVDVEKCDGAAELRALAAAISSTADYFDQYFECRHTDCLQKAARICWVGTECEKIPKSVLGGVLVEFYCKPEK